MGKPNIAELQAKLLASHWPKCNELAETIAAVGGDEARSALIAGLSGKRHHIRSAAIRSLAKLGDSSVVGAIEPHLDDSSYEVRIDAKEAIEVLTGVAVPTARGE